MGRMSREVRVKGVGGDRKTWEGPKQDLTPPELESKCLTLREDGWFNQLDGVKIKVMMAISD